MLLSHNWLTQYYTNPEAVPTPEKVADFFTMRAFEIESIEKKGDDTIYDLKITADRAPYALGLRYVALELSLLVPELQLKPNVLEIIQSATEVDSQLIAPAAKDFCSVYSLTKIENIHNNASPAWVKTRLESIGQQSRGLVVDLTNLTMFDTGQPLHVFDADKIDGQIRVDVSKEGENITILGGKEVALATGTLVIRDDMAILAIAGVKGGVKAEVTETTKTVYLESALFHGPKVRRTARSLNLLNDSSKRFEQQLTPERYMTGQNVYVNVLKEVLSEAVVGVMKVSNTVDIPLRKISIDVASAVISIHKEDSTVPEKFAQFVEHILPKTGAVVEKDESGYVIIAPHYRSDLQTQADVVDEFLRNVGYEFLEYTEPKKNPVFGLVDSMDQLSFVLRDFFIQKGFDEVKLHTLVDSKENSSATKLANALTSERDSLRSDLSTNMSIALEQNIRHLDLVGKKMVQLFEIGTVFVDKKNNVEEKTHLSFGVAMAKWPKGQSADVYLNEIKVELEKYLDCGSLEIVKNLGYTTTSTAIEISLENIKTNDLQDLISKISPYKTLEKIAYKKASIYPSMSRDIAFFGSNEEGEVASFIKAQVEKNPLIENYFQFDKFTKEDKTSYGYRFVFQSYEKTLTEEEVSVVMSAIASEVTVKGWTVR